MLSGNMHLRARSTASIQTQSHVQRQAAPLGKPRSAVLASTGSEARPAVGQAIGQASTDVQRPTRSCRTQAVGLAAVCPSLLATWRRGRALVSSITMQLQYCDSAGMPHLDRLLHTFPRTSGRAANISALACDDSAACPPALCIAARSALCALSCAAAVALTTIDLSALALVSGSIFYAVLPAVNRQRLRHRSAAAMAVARQRIATLSQTVTPCRPCCRPSRP